MLSIDTLLGIIQTEAFEEGPLERNPPMSCTCDLCLRTGRFREALSRVPEADREFWDGIYLALDHAESDRDYWEARAKGQWPGQ